MALRMPVRTGSRTRRTAALAAALTVTPLLVVNGAVTQAHAEGGQLFRPGNLLVSRTVYRTPASTIVPGTTMLPAGCTGSCVPAVADGSYPGVWNNEAVDPSFGVTSPIYLDQMTPNGRVVGTFAVPHLSGVQDSGRQYGLVTSFPSKSELALNLSTDGRSVTFMGYVAPTSSLDVSNSNTPGVVDPSDPVTTAYYRGVAQLDADGRLQITDTNAYSGNNGRAAILDNTNGADVYFTAGNAGNGGNPEPTGVILGAGAQLVRPSREPIWWQHPAVPTPVGSFNIAQLGDKADKIGKDTNFRGLAIYDNVVYLTKGSGGNGVNTVYFVDTTGQACPTGVGLPQPGAALPTQPVSYDPSTLQTQGLPTNMCILRGFPTGLKSTTSFPFGLWFANPTTLYVADEGNGDATYDTTTGTYSTDAAQPTAGLQKWSLVDGTWQRDYTLQNGLSLGTPYTVSGYPTGDNPSTGLPWAPATDGLRNITGRVNPDGTVTVWGITSTVSGATDTGADPNRLVGITDSTVATSLPGAEAFTTLRTADSGEALRGVSLTPQENRRR